MQKILVIAGREFWERVRTRGFILSSLFTPLILIVVWATSSLAGPMQVEEAPGDEAQPGEAAAEQQEADDELSLIAYVDEADIIQRVPETLPDEMFRAYPDEAAAQAALEAGELDVYFVIEADYRETGKVRRVSAQIPASPPLDTSVLDALLQANLLPEATPQELARVQAPFQSPSLRVTSLDGAAEDSGGGFDGLPMMPFLVTVLVMIPLFTSASYLLASLAQEKSSRVMEILLVSLRPRDLLAGKLLGLGALTMVQYVIWIVLGAGAFFLLGADLSAVTNTINLTLVEVGLVLLFALGGYALYAALMAGLGALSPNLEATRTWVFVITLPMLIPMYTWVMLVNSPHSVLSVALSLFPFSAPIAMLMRLTSTTVPGWQIALSLALVGLTAVAMVWLMSRLFLAQTLLSGEPFSPRRFWTVVREG